eukprot:gene18775-20666_t
MKNIILLVIALFVFKSCSGDDNHGEFCHKHGSDGACESFDEYDDDDDDDQPFWFNEAVGDRVVKRSSNEKLVRLEPKEIGHEEEVELEGKKYRLITRAKHPLLFEVPNFVDDNEIKRILERAESSGMFSSRAKGGLTPQDFFKPSQKPGKSLGPAGEFSNWDQNKDGIIDIEDIFYWSKYYHYLVLSKDEVLEMFSAVGVSEFDDEKITEEEFETMNTQGVEDYVNLLMREHPRFRQRFSEQTWLPMEKAYGETLHRIRERVVKLTKLPRKLVYDGENMQVVKYGPDGHYHCHHDSETHERNDVPCCHQKILDHSQEYGKCKLCRFITLMIYLNDVEEGGETAFPAAHNETYDDQVLRVRGAIDYMNLNDYCHKSNLVIQPKKGSALLWYNHLIDAKTGWLGELEEQSLHGGCKVKKGEKWIANIWLPAPYADSADLPSIYFNKEDYENAERTSNEGHFSTLPAFPPQFLSGNDTTMWL